jgi:uncharacterized protein (TIGR03083 family)
MGGLSCPWHARGMEHREYLDGVQAQINAMAADLQGKDPTSPVSTCPEWDLAALIQHTGRVHRWVTETARSRSMEYVNWKKLDLGLPDDPSALPGWLAAGADPLIAALSAADPMTPLWSFAAEGSIGWWARRQLHETTVHRADGQLAVGLPAEIPDAVALDGIEELLGVMLPAVGSAKRVAELGRSGDSLHLHATDAPGEWTITLTEGGFRWDRGHSKATVAVRGAASDLYLLMWNRRRPADAERFEIFGDAALLHAWLAAATV